MFIVQFSMSKLLFRPTLHIGFDVAEGAVARQMGFEGDTGDEGEVPHRPGDGRPAGGQDALRRNPLFNKISYSGS